MDLPWPTITAAAGGWALLGLGILGLMSGKWFVSRREADVYLVRAEKAEANVDKLIAALMGTTAVGRLQQRLVQAATEATQEPPEDGP
jgi:hypothetical protein